MVGELVSNFKINDNDPIVITSSNLPSYLKYSVTYSDGEEILLNHELKSGDSETYKVRLEFKKDITEEDLPQDEITIMFGFSPILTQADSRKISRHNNDAFTTETDVRSIQNAIQQYDIDHDACMNFAINDDDIGESQAEDYCSGKNISVCSKLCYNRSIENDFILLKEQGIVDNERYVKIKSYDINYNKCIDALNSNDMYDESVRDSYCKGEDITTYFYPCSRCAGVETITNIDLDIQNGAGTQMSNSGAIENIVYEEVQPDIYITDYDESYGTDVVIPSKINGSKVIGISDNAFNGKGITSVKIPDTVEYVGYGAFANNPLEKVEIVDTDYTYISDCAFGKLRNISEHNIPSTYQCTSSETCFTAELNAENENEAFITGYDENCGSDVSIPSNMWLPKCEDNSCTYGSRTIVGIKEEAFKSKNIEYVDIPNTVTTIETNAFEDNILKDVYLNTTDANIGDCAFGLEDKIEHHNLPNSYVCSKCFLKSISESGDITITGYDSSNADCGKNIKIPSHVNENPVVSILANSFNNLNINSVSIPESVTSVGDNAFDNNSLKKVQIDNSNTILGECAFGLKESIENHNLPNSYSCVKCFMYSTSNKGEVTITGYHDEIKECSKDVIIPSYIKNNPVISIHNDSFNNLGITSVVVPETVTSVGDNAFNNNILKKVQLDNRDAELGLCSFGKKENIENHNLPNNYSCPNVTSCFTMGDITDGLEIKSYDLDYDKCLNVYQAYAHEGVNIQNACRGDIINYEDSSYTLKDELNSDSSLMNVFLENEVLINIQYQKVASYDINLDTCSSVAQNEYYYYDEDNTAYCSGNVTSDGQSIPRNIKEGKTQDLINKGIIENVIYEDATPTRAITGYNSTCSKDVVIPTEVNGEEVTDIARDAFKGQNLESVVIPNTVTHIGMNAFSGNSLHNVELKNTNVEIDNCAFGSLSDIENHNIPNTYKCETPQYCFKEGRMWQDVISVLDSRIVDGYNVDYCGTDVVIPDGVMQINRNAFSNMGITSLVIPESVEYIESNAFDDNPLKKLSFTNQNARIENCAFGDVSSIKNIDILNNYKCIRPAEHDLASSYIESKTGTGGLITDDFGNTRYQGTSYFHELNNSVYLNCSDYDNPTDSSCERWSIVGVFDVKRSEDSNFQKRVKLVRDNYLGDYDGYSWDSSDSSVNSGKGVNEWSQADLMHELNENYLDTDLEGIIKWYNDSNNQKEVDFDSKYVMNRETQNLIDDAIWHTGGYKMKEKSSYLWEEREPNELYKLDRGSDLVENPKDGITRHSTWRGKVGLLYPSDFSYATTNLNVMIPSVRYAEHLGRYQNNSDYNWMASKGKMWMLNPGLSETGAACVRNTTNWSYFLVPGKCPVSDRLKVYPSVYLKADVKVTGEGTYSNPYVFSLD